MRRTRRRVEPTVATHFPSLSRRFDLNQNVHMFTEDVHLAVMPIGGRTEKHKDFSVSFEGDSRECQRARDLIGAIDRYDRYDDKEIVCDAVEEIARHLAWEGSATYEILREEDGGTYLHSFTSKRLAKLAGLFIQFIPREDWRLWKKQLVVVPASDVWYLEMPQQLGGRSGYKRVVGRLAKFEHIGPEFWKRDLELGQPTRNFDFQEYVRNTEIYYGRVTRAWGWNRRDWSLERSTEFFGFYKTVTFRWAQAVLREYIIAELNQLLARLGINCKVSVTGLPTSEEILQTRRDLQEGKVSFGSAMDRVSI